MHRIRENSGTSMKADNTPTAAAPTKMPMSAVTMGRPIATTEPNATSRTMTATPMPMSSLLGVLLCELGQGTRQLDLHATGAGLFGHRGGVMELCGGELVDGVGDVEVGRLARLR